MSDGPPFLAHCQFLRFPLTVNSSVSRSLSIHSTPTIKNQIKSSNQILFRSNKKYMYMSNQNKKVLLRGGHVAHNVPSSCDPKT